MLQGFQLGKSEQDGEGWFRRYQRWEARHRKVVIPIAALAGIAFVAVVDPTDFKWYIAMVGLAVVGYRVAAAREAEDSQRERD